ncbi:hypothetical protein [Leifsonia sp. Leaf264]|uniref:hypothetical protein n=1 Tax=Leifsonia sp. Leaf264 TaxID=1736314 RepID=UPI00070181FD|nr:hypothetical protein [Leifsonia sp. Leaf264]KQO98139.1 hypothetical protein ASF30_08715 [Leifsonia sp. Leaf264]
MGHSTAQVVVDLTPGKSDWNLVTEAVSKWYDEEAGRWSDANEEHPRRLATHPEKFAANPTELEDYSPGTFIVPIAEPEDVTVKTVKFVVEIPETQANQIKATDWWNDSYFDLFKKVGDLHKGAFVIDMKLDPIKLRKFTAAATEGTAKTVYSIVGFHGGRNETPKVVGEGFESMAKARAAAVEHANTADKPALRYEVRADVRRDDNVALVVIERPLDRTVKVTGTIEVHTVKAGAKPKKAMVLFDYHH